MKKLKLIIAVVIILVIIIASFVLLVGKNNTDSEDLSENKESLGPENIDVDNLNKELEELDSLDELLDSNNDSEIIDLN
jgi:uncharacterized protein YpmS